jgi:peptidoglycan-associated lipoprotein
MIRPAPFVLVLAVLVAAGCHHQPPPPVKPAVNEDSIRRAAEQRRLDSIARARQDSIARAQAAADAERQRREAEAAAERARMEAAHRTLLETVYFDYDQSELRGDARSLLDQKLSLLRATPAIRIRISGHADERGSDEYNLALGQRRAEAVKQYLVNGGIDASRIETRSFGEERPAVMGSTEDAYAKNRRAEFEITAGGNDTMGPR